MADFRLPELKPANVDYVNAFAKGYAAPAAMQAPEIQNTLNQQKIAEEQNKLAAGAEYARTGDIGAYGKVDPIHVEAARIAKQKQILDSVKPGLDYAYAMIPSLTPENYGERRKTAVNLSPALEGMLPPEYNSEAITNFSIQYGNMKKLEKLGEGDRVLAPGGILVGPSGNIKARAPLAQPTGLQQAQEAKAWADVKNPGRSWKPERYVPEKEGEGQAVWIKPGDNVPAGYIGEKQKIAQSSDLTIDPGAIDAMAQRYMIDGTMPGLGLGKAATKARSMVMNKVAELMETTGQTPQDLKTNQIIAGGLRSEANKLLGQRGPMLAFAKTADLNLDIALDLSGKVGRTGVPVINRWLLAGKKSIAGDPEVAAFHAATQVAINEFAKVTSSATGGGVTSDQARKEIEDVLNTAYNPEQFKAVVKTLRLDMNNRVAGYEDSLKRLQEAGKNIGKPASGGKGIPKQLTDSDRQAYTQKLTQVQSLPDGPQKQAALKQMQDLADKWGIK